MYGLSLAEGDSLLWHMLSMLGNNNIKRDLYLIYVTHVEPTGTGRAGGKV